MRFTDSLRFNRDFRRMYARGKSTAGVYLAFYWSRNRAGRTRLGLTVGSKLGGAVQRNRVRRRIKEAYRLVEDKLTPGFDLVIVARVSAQRATFSALQNEIVQCVHKLAAQEGGKRRV